MIGRTPRQQELLNFLFAHFAAHSVMPSRAKMRAALRTRSRSHIFELLQGLAERGAIIPSPVGHGKFELVQTQNNDLSDCHCEGCMRAVSRQQARASQALVQHPPSQVG